MKVAILGAAGAIGKATEQVLRERGVDVRVVGRDVRKLAGFANSEQVAADVATREGCDRALAGVDAAVYSLGLPYTKNAFATYVPMMELCLAAARAAGVRQLVLITNVYPYGRPQTPRIGEDHARVTCSVKGEHRKRQEDLVLAADSHDGLRTLSLRLPNFYGPDAELSLSAMIFKAALAGKKADLLGPIDTPQELVYTPDVGPVVADLIARPEAFGRAYNYAGPGDTTFRDFATRIYRAVGAEPRFRVASPGLVKVMGLFSGLMRELSEMMYLQQTPILLDDTRLRGVLPELKKTSYDEGIRLTVEALRHRQA